MINSKDKLSLTIILGSAREGRSSYQVANWVQSACKKDQNLDISLIDVADYNLGRTVGARADSSLAENWRQIATKSDAFFIVAPEYNHGYPGELKQLLDSAYQEYEKKPVSICGVSSGIMGGVRMVEQLRLVLIELKLVPTRLSLHMPKVKELFDDQGEIRSGDHSEKLETVIEELLWFARVLKWGRENDI